MMEEGPNKLILWKNIYNFFLNFIILRQINWMSMQSQNVNDYS